MSAVRPIQIDISDLLYPAQAEIAEHPARFRVVVAGRRWGKTMLGAAIITAAALEGGKCWWVAPSFPMASIAWRMLKGLIWQLAPYVEIAESERIVRFHSDGFIQIKSSDNPDSLRGEGLDCAVFDEAAYHVEEAWTEAIRPALSDRQGKAVFISTPAGRNWFFHVYQNGLVGNSEWQSWHYPTSSNPHIAQAEIEAARDSLPHLVFEQEYLAQFTVGHGQVFHNIAACLVPDDQTPEMHRGHRIVGGVDWAQTRDFTAIALVCVDCRRELFLDRFHGDDWKLQRARLEAAYVKWGCSHLSCETNAMGSPNLQELASDGYDVSGFTTTAQSKPPIIQSLALAFEKEQFRWLDNPVARYELEAYEMKQNPVTGRPTYSAPEGCHDDTVVARALALRVALIEPIRLI